MNVKNLNILANIILLSLLCATSRAQTLIYSDSFNGGAVSIDGTAPTLAYNYAGGSSSATWNVLSNSATAYMNQNGTIGANQNTALLAFTPTVGYLYTLTATVDFTGNPGNWVDLGFAAHDPIQNTGSAKMTDTSATGPDGNDWMIFTPAAGGEQFFAGPGTGNSIVSGAYLEGTGTWTVQLDLNTMGSQWTTSAFIDGIQMGTTYTYSSDPEIVAAGYGENSLGASTKVKWDEIDLTATPAPEPSTFALAGLGAGALLLICRKQKRA